jgi:FAD dependent oxidoreductase TIGR03364
MLQEFDDAVVGAGVLGLAHAYHLARRGRRVAVFERSRQACGASVRNFGMLWPIGQPAGPLLHLAQRSLEYWRQVLPAAGLWHDPCGSLHLAYHDDELQVLREFVEAAPTRGYTVELLSPAAVQRLAPAVRPAGLRGGMFSPVETCIDPRQVIARLPAWLTATFSVAFHFEHLVTGFDAGTVTARGRSFSADRLWVCSGEDLQTLYPEVLADAGLRRCKLQMMRSQAYDGFRVGPMLAAGLTQRHYKSFADCPTLAAVRQRVAAESPAFDRYGVHVLVSQNGRGEVTLGDSHEYDQGGEEPFSHAHIDRLVLDYLHTFLDLPDLTIVSRWQGVYMSHPELPFIVAHPAADVTVVNGVGGNGMTLSFGLAEQAVTSVLGEAA